MGNKRKKRRTHVPAEEADYNKTPKSFVIKSGEVGLSVNALVKDIRRVMSPCTASKLRERKGNKLKDFVHIAGQLAITHLIIFSKTDAGVNLRMGRIPRGPTLSFRVQSYVLAKDILAVQQRPKSPGSDFKCSPLVVLNNFNDDSKHIKLMATMFQNLFPPINVQTMKLADARRVVLFHLDPETKVIEFRHYSVGVKVTGVSKSVKTIIQTNIPDLHKFDDISDYVLRGAYASESDVEDGPESTVVLGQKYVGRGNRSSEQRAIRLVELGPRMQLKLLKIQIKKTEKEMKEIKKRREEREREKAKRRAEQEANVKKKQEQALAAGGKKRVRVEGDDDGEEGGDEGSEGEDNDDFEDEDFDEEVDSDPLDDNDELDEASDHSDDESGKKKSTAALGHVISASSIQNRCTIGQIFEAWTGMEVVGDVDFNPLEVDQFKVLSPRENNVEQPRPYTCNFCYPGTRTSVMTRGTTKKNTTKKRKARRRAGSARTTGWPETDGSPTTPPLLLPRHPHHLQQGGLRGVRDQAICDVVKATYQPDKESMKDFRPKTGGLVNLVCARNAKQA
ncbi:hypothetical protein HDV05_006440 [Chytridiales sp. JEL 0842]|nr:hypothetical protein HDV05_006440 [Chytridiales sp. JEL 0842]